MKNSKKMKFLIAGLGSIGQRHLKNLIFLGEKDIILFRTGKGTLVDLDKEFPVYRNIDEAMDQKPDAVIISNPTSLHMPIAEIAAKSNVHIFIEKPISHTLDSLHDFELALEGSNTKVFVAYQFRFNVGLMKIKGILEREVLGKPRSFTARWGEYLPDWHPWEDYRNSYAAHSEMGGGVVLTLSHPIDYLYWLFGDVIELQAEAGNKSDLDLECEDFADTHITFRSGVEGDLWLDYFTRPKVHDLSIQCEKGDLSWNYRTNCVNVKKQNESPQLFEPSQDYDRNNMYIDEMAHFIAVCKDGIQPVCSYQDGKRVLDIALGILQSARYHDRVVFDR